MSTLKVDAIRHNSATSDAITTAADGTCTAKLTSINDGALSNRNLLHNSSFEVWQRGTTSASAASGGNRYTADRWSVPNRTRVARSTDVPAGFKYAILLDREQTGGSEPFTLHQGIEKDNIRQTGSYTLSFYAKSSDINSVNINVQDRTTVAEGGTNHSSIVTNQAVTITSSWARYTYTFTLSSIALSGTCLRISIGNTSADQNDELLLTGIQLETGTTATDIEKRSLGHELSLCQRYYEETYVMSDAGTSYIRVPVYYAVEKRTAGTAYVYAKRPDGVGSGTINKAYQGSGERDAECRSHWTGGTMLFNTGSYSSNTDYLGQVKIEVEL